MTSTKSKMLEAALEYASRGWRVFCLEELGKAPRLSVRDGGKGVHDSTTDKQQITTWLSRWPNCNLGVHAESFFVLDVDTKNSGPASLDGLIRTYGPIGETLRQRTPSGGTHYFFKSPIGLFIKNSSGFYPGLDVRSYGGYVAVAPSETEAGVYEWENNSPIAEAPAWLLALVTDKREGFKQSQRSDTGTRDVDDASLTGYLMNGGLNEDQIFDVLQKRNNDPNFRDVPLPTNELWKTVRSIFKRDIRIPSQLRQALQDNANRIQSEALTVQKPDELWEDRLVRNKSLIPKNILANVEACLTHSPLFCNALAFDELRAEVILTRNIVDPINSKPVYHLTAGTVVTEHIVREMVVLAQRLVTSVTFTEDTFGQAISHVARQSAFHPIQDFLNGLVWDGVKRIDTWLIDHLGVEDDEEGYARGIGRRWLISAVGRAIKPGSKADCMLIIEGPQGMGKSPALETLAGKDWFKDSPIDFTSKDKFGSVKGTWIYELAEFDQYKANDAATIKSFLSSKEDTYRPPYGRSDVKQPRGLVFAGTTNTEKYLVDPTGDKRFWPVKSVRHNREKPIDLAKLESARGQIWAEATRAYYNGESGFIDMPELMASHERQAQLRHDNEDTWEHEALIYMKSVGERKDVTTSDVLLHAISIPLSRQSGKEQNRVRRILELNGYEYKSVRNNGRVTKAWRKRI
jgi:predicted P-loop ATPase